MIPNCPTCGNNKVERNGFCASCNRDSRKAEALALKPKKELKPIKRQSDKQKTALQEYIARVNVWKAGKMCVVFQKEIATTCHHSKGRIGFADKWARDRGITLLMDERYWIPASLEGHRWIEEHPQEAKDRGWSQSRLENLDQDEPTV